MVLKLLLVIGVFLFAHSRSAQAVDWPMAGANPERTSWTNDAMPDNISTLWVKPIYPYVPQKVQVIGAEGKVFVSTGAGLYAFDAATGADSWRYATALPLSNSPTYANGILYVGGLDKKVYAINASNGNGVWTYTAQGGFSTNPVVVNGKVYLGSRDGAFYAINTSNGSLAWKYQTGNQIMQSAAFKDGVLFFASNDGYAYALNADTGSLVWKSSSKLPSQGFAWWPTVYGNDVIFTRSAFYSTAGIEVQWLLGSAPTSSMFPGITSFETQSGYWPVGEKIMDLRTNPYGYTFPDYFETQESGDSRPQHGPYRRNVFFFNRATGVERQFDIDSDGKTDGAPVSFIGDGGSHPPPVVSGHNNVLYFNSLVRGVNASWGGASVFGWKVGTPFISLTSDGFRSADEPMAISAAGNKVYYVHCCDRGVTGVNISRPNTDNSGDPIREWNYISGQGIPNFTWPIDSSALPNTQTNFYYNEAVKFFWNPQPLDPPCCPAVFWNENDKVGPTPYNGRLYLIMGNSLIALGTGGAGTNSPRLASAPNITTGFTSTVTDTELRSKLEQEVLEILAAGHLKPSYLFSGLISTYHSRTIDDYLFHYWHNPAEIHLVLLRALPYLSTTLQNQVRTYLQNEYANYNPAQYAHIGYGSGAQRDTWLYPPIDTAISSFNLPQTKQAGSNFNNTWGFPPNNVYMLWKYAQAGLGNASTILSQLGTRLRAPITQNNVALTDDYLANHPLVSNAYIAGYKGYVELAKMAGQSQSQYGPFESEMNRLLALKPTQLTPFPDSSNSGIPCRYRCYYPSMITYYHFAYMTKELADYLRTNARSSDPNRDILSILQKYQDIAPYWMEAHNGETQGEHAIQPYQQTHSLFQGLAMVKRAPREELLKYLDSPVVPVGDLYYIDNLVAVLESSGISPTIPLPPTIPGDATGDGHVNNQDFVIWKNNFMRNLSSANNGDFDNNSNVDGRDFIIWLIHYGQ